MCVYICSIFTALCTINSSIVCVMFILFAERSKQIVVVLFFWFFFAGPKIPT